MWKIMNIEIRKLKSSGMLWVVFGIPLALTLMNLFLSRQFYRGGEPNWESVQVGQLGLYVIFLLPGIIAVVMATMMRVEHRGNGWKYLFSLPVRKGHVFCVKFLLGTGMVFLNMLMVSLGSILIGLLVGAPEPVPYRLFLTNPGLAFLLAIPIMMLQFILGLIFTQPLIPIGIGVGLGMPAILMANSARYWKFYPWTYPVITCLGDVFRESHQIVLMFSISGVLFLTLFIGGWVYFRRRDILN